MSWYHWIPPDSNHNEWVGELISSPINVDHKESWELTSVYLTERALAFDVFKFGHDAQIVPLTTSARRYTTTKTHVTTPITWQRVLSPPYMYVCTYTCNIWSCNLRISVEFWFHWTVALICKLTSHSKPIHLKATEVYKLFLITYRHTHESCFQVWSTKSRCGYECVNQPPMNWMTVDYTVDPGWAGTHS